MEDVVMPNVQKISVAITPEMADTVRRVVDGGEYASASEVVRDALRDWKTRRDRHEAAIELLRQVWDIGIDSGPALDADETFRDLIAEIDEIEDARDGR